MIKLMVVLSVVLLVLLPLATLWALNTLFGLGLPYTVNTWAAASVLTGIVTAGNRK